MMGNCMPQNSRNRKLACALCAVLGLTIAVASNTVVFAADDSDANDMWGMKTMKKMLSAFGVGNSQSPGAAIEYQERPPLVVPSNRDLPPPVTAASPAANNGGWPSDPDDKKSAEARKVKRERKSVQNGDQDRPQEPAQSQPGFASSMWSGMVGAGKSIAGEKEVETRTFVHEPSRNALTDPPAGYRTPSPIQPYGINGKPDRSKSDVDRQAETVK
jgi:hypothetical protein